MRYIGKDLKSSMYTWHFIYQNKDKLMLSSSLSMWYSHHEHSLSINQDFITKFAHPSTDKFLLPNTSKYCTVHSYL